MKKFLSIALVLIISCSCLAFTSCGLFGDDDITGVYEMTEISGTITYGGQTHPLSEDLYDYYRITLNDDGSVIIEARGNGSSAIREEGRWEYDEPNLDVISVRGGYTVVEEMELKDGVITYNAPRQYDSLTGMTIEMSMTLEKVGSKPASIFGIFSEIFDF